MSKEVNIDEILTRSHKQAEEKNKPQKAAKVLDSETGEEMSPKSSKSKAAANQPFGGATGMPGDFSQIFNDPNVMKMFSQGNMPGLKSLPLKQRIMFKLMGFFSKPGRVQMVKNKWLWPIWAVVLLVLIALALVAAVFFFIFKILKALIMPYVNLFRRKG